MSSASIERKIREFQTYGLERRAYLFYEREIDRYFEAHDEAPTADDLEEIERRREAWEARTVAKYRAFLEKKEAERRKRMEMLQRKHIVKHVA